MIAAHKVSVVAVLFRSSRRPTSSRSSDNAYIPSQMSGLRDLLLAKKISVSMKHTINGCVKERMMADTRRQEMKVVTKKTELKSSFSCVSQSVNQGLSE
jgi:hypothetical protein